MAYAYVFLKAFIQKWNASSLTFHCEYVKFPSGDNFIFQISTNTLGLKVGTPKMWYCKKGKVKYRCSKKKKS